MAIVLKDRVKETSSAPGTGTITLGGAVAGFQGFSAIGNGNVTYFAIVDSTSGAWEVNYGTYTTSGSTLTRNATPLSSSAAGALVNFTGTVEVFCTYPSEKAIYEEVSGNVLIDGGPITVIGNGVTSYTTFSAALGELYANIDSFAQLYAQNLNDGTEASSDFVAYNDLGDGVNNFVDVGINSSNYTSTTYPIFTPGSAYVFNDGGEMIIGSATDDVLLFAGGVATTDWAARIDKTTKNITTVADIDVGGDVNATGGTFTAPVTTTSSMLAPGATEFVTRAYVDEATSNGFHVHTPVLVATTGNLTATYNQPGGAGVGVGATLTNSGTQVALSIDGVAMATNDRVLVWQQTTGLQNGIYVVTTVGSGSTNWVLTRSADANTSSEGDPGTLGGGDYFFVQSGDTQGFFAFVCTNTSAIVFGTTAITFNEFSQVPVYTGTAPINVSGQTIALTGTVAATNGGTGTSTVTTGDLLYGSASNTWSKLAAGAGYKSLVMNAGGTLPEWNAVALNQSGAVSGALGEVNGGTGQNTYTLGDTLYSSAANTIAKLAGNTTTTKKFLAQTGTGSVSAAPSWDTISGSDVTGNISGQAGSVANALTAGTYLTSAGTYNGAAARTFAVDATDANTASKVVARDASGNFSAGTITATLSGSATSATTATNLAGGAANRIAYQTGAGATTFAVAPSASNQVLNWNGSAFTWSAGTISGIPLGSNLSTLTFGTYLTGTSYNGSGAVTLATNATNLNTASTLVARDGSGNFSAGTITASLNGNASTATSATSATTATTATNLAGGSAGTVPYQSAANTTVQLAAGTSGQVLRSNGAAAPSWVNGTISGIALGNNLNTLTMNVSGTGLSGSNTYNGSGAATFTVTSNATNANSGNAIVARDGSGNFSAGTITAALSGTATTANNLAGGSAGTIPYQSAAGTTVQLAAGTSGFFLRSNGAAAPSWVTAPSSPAATPSVQGTVYARQDTSAGYQAFGYLAMGSVTSGLFNTAVGQQALRDTTTASGSTAVGHQSLIFANGAANTAVGYQTLYSNSNGLNNTAVGYQALYSHQNGQDNTAIGYQSMYSATGATYNTAIGRSAMTALTTGSGNIAVGAMTGAGAVSPVFAITNQQNRISMGSTAVTNAYVQVAWTVVSDARDKTDFAPVPHGLDFVTKLKPTAYRFKESRDATEGHGPLRYGFKAQDILELEGDNPVVIDAGTPEKLYFNDQNLLAILVKAVQEQQVIIDQLKADVAALKGN